MERKTPYESVMPEDDDLGIDIDPTLCARLEEEDVESEYKKLVTQKHALLGLYAQTADFSERHGAVFKLLIDWKNYLYIR